MNLHIEKIGWEQLETVYHTYMVPDFDGHGLKPLSAIRYLWDKGCYEGIFLYEGTDLRAYALFVADRETGYLLLDYLAVCSRERGRDTAEASCHDEGVFSGETEFFWRRKA